jgi:ATP-dependent Clp protease ATP-binding subunit ClpA
MFSPEFRNRLDARISFAALTREVMSLVVEKFLKELSLLLQERNVTLELSDDARSRLAIQGYDADFGARPLIRLVQEKLKRPLADALLFGRLANGGRARFELKDNDFVLTDSAA